MAKLLRLKSGDMLPARLNETAVLRELNVLFREAGFVVAQTVTRNRPMVDLVLSRAEFGQLRNYGIEVKLGQVDENSVRRVRDYLHGDDIDELWLVGREFTKGARKVVLRGESIRLFTFEELTEALRLEKDHHPESVKTAMPRARTAIGRAVAANHVEIVLMSTSLLLLIDEKLEALRHLRPNSREAVAERDYTVRHFEKLKDDLIGLRNVANKFSVGEADEKQVEKLSRSFAVAVREWWNKSSNQICKKTFDMALFASSIAICSAAGASGNIAVVVSAAMVGGKPIADVLKNIAKKALQ